jgi:hypothetical protein
MKSWPQTVKDAIYSGSLANMATLLAGAWQGRRSGDSALRPVNAVSHIVCGSEAARQSSASLKYTATGVALNQAGATFWALIYERLFGAPAESSAARALAGGACVSALAYVVDYHLVPKRLTPGYEDALPPRGLVPIYAALALSLSASSLLRGSLKGEP